MSVLVQYATEVTASAIFEDQPQVVSGLIPVVKAQDMWALQLVHYLHFAHDLYLFFLIIFSTKKDIYEINVK